MGAPPPPRVGLAVVARSVGKRFEIYASRSTSLKEMVIKNLFDRGERVIHEALAEVSFQVGWGRSLAIVGGNGSGKSTLLKLIAGISEPTAGSLTVGGKVASLLELGAGFQPELTGMENIYLQGAIMGMERATIHRRLEQILDFCDLGKFIHTPMKRYSSGMTVRLGFALAAYSDAPIILVDEVLAVGDSAFQVKCLQKIADLRRHGRTILFVSHIAEHVELVADEVLWLEGGRTQGYGSADEILGRYLDAQQGLATRAAADSSASFEEGARQLSMRSATALSTMKVEHREARIEHVEILDNESGARRAFRAGEPIVIEITLTILREIADGINVHIGYAGSGGLRIGFQSSKLQALAIDGRPGTRRVRVEMPGLPFQPGRYLLSIALAPPDSHFDFYDMHLRAYAIQVRGEVTSESGAVVLAPGAWDTGPVTPP